MTEFPHARTCRACGKPMVFYLTEKAGRAIPLDPEPHPDGNVLIRMGRAVVLRKDAVHTEEPRYRSHFATCPHAEEFRRRV